MWITSYRVETSIDGNTYTNYTDKPGTPAKIFDGNKDGFTGVTRLFNRKVVAQYVRIYPLTYNGLPALQFNIIGCNPSAVPMIGDTGAPTAAPGGGQGQPTLLPNTGNTGQATPPPISGTGRPTAAPQAGHFEEPSPGKIIYFK